MITIQTPFTDCHGIQYTAPVIQIAQASYNSNSSMQISAQGDNHISPHNHTSHSLNYRADIWLDAEKKAAGLKPLVLKDKNGNDWHTVVLSGPETDATAIVELCEEHILSTIIPQLTPTQAQE